MTSIKYPIKNNHSLNPNINYELRKALTYKDLILKIKKSQYINMSGEYQEAKKDIYNNVLILVSTYKEAQTFFFVIFKAKNTWKKPN